MRVFILLMVLLLMAVPVMSHATVAESDTEIVMVSAVAQAADFESVIAVPVLATQVSAQVRQYKQKRTALMIGPDVATLDAYDSYHDRQRRSRAISIAGRRDSF